MSKLFIKVFFLIVLSINYANAELLKPNKLISPSKVLSIQLNSLKNNNYPYVDAGIEQAWIFAHPNNKKNTGPLKNFKKMIYSPNYEMLIDHKSAKINIINKNVNTIIYEVYILSKNKKKYLYIWKIQKVLTEGILKNCWMTTAVSSPQFLGDVI